MGERIPFPGANPALGLQPVKATYSVAEIAHLFGLSERDVRRWAKTGLIQPIDVDGEELQFDFNALTRFRTVRELRKRGLGLRGIEKQLQGQLPLFEAGGAQILPLRRLTPFEEGLVAHERHEHERAANLFRQAIDDGDHIADALTNLSLIAADAGDDVAALDLVTLALSEEPRHVEGQYNLACLYFKLEDLLLAKLHFELCAAIEPGFTNVYYNLGLVYAALGELGNALRALETYREQAGEDDGDGADELIAMLRAVQATAGPERL